METSHALDDQNDARAQPSNENKMSDGGRRRASLAVKVWKSSQKWSVQRSAVRSIAWLGVGRCNRKAILSKPEYKHLNVAGVKEELRI
jgi:hypothetical protein